jgi:hypothetical protein
MICAAASYGGSEDYRTWYFTGTPQAPTVTQSPPTTAKMRGVREDYWLTT